MDNVVFSLILDNPNIKNQLFDCDKTIAYLMDNYKNKTVVLPSIWYTNNVTEYHKKLNHWIMI
jgi:hypothetical protein